MTSQRAGSVPRFGKTELGCLDIGSGFDLGLVVVAT